MEVSNVELSIIINGFSGLSYGKSTPITLFISPFKAFEYSPLESLLITGNSAFGIYLYKFIFY